MSNGDKSTPEPIDKIAKDVVDKDVKEQAAGGRPGKRGEGQTSLRPLDALKRIPAAVSIPVAIAVFGVIALGVYQITTGGGDTPPKGTELIASGYPSCDCPNTNAGLLDPEYQRQCLERENELRVLAAEDRLKFVVRDGLIVSGDLCDPVASGPAAWPVEGAGTEPPPGPPPGQLCASPQGIARTCPT